MRPDPASGVTLVPFVPERDLALVESWLRQPHVTRWWGDPDRALREVHARPAGGGDALIMADGAAVGYIRWQIPSREELDAAGLQDVPASAVDIDIAIGAADRLGQGIGSAAVRRLRDMLVGEGVRTIILGTSADNTRALRACEKAGFARYRQFADPECGACWLLIYEAPRG